MATTTSPQPTLNGSTPAEPDSDPPPQPEPESEPTRTETHKWAGWPGDCVFRLVVPVLKVGSIIGRKGELIKKICDDTSARVRVLDAPTAVPDRIVLISGKEELEASLSPAMDAALRVFKRVSGLPEGDVDGQPLGAAGAVYCSARLLVPSIQASSLIGKQGSLIKSIQESSGASARILQADESPSYVGADERIVELQGEALKVLKALEAAVGHLRKFLVDRGVLPLFDKNYQALISQDQERQAETWPEKSILRTAPQTALTTSQGTEYSLLARRGSLFLDTERHLDSMMTSSGLSHYRPDPVLSRLRSSGLGRTGAPNFVTQVAQTMQIPLSYAENIIGIGGANIAYIRRTSGATLTVQESRGLPDEITVEIKGSASEVQVAQQLIQEFVSDYKEPVTSSYDKLDAGLRSSYSQLGSSSYSSPSLPSRPYGGYGASGGGYSSFRF